MHVFSPQQYVLENGQFVLRGIYNRYPAFMLRRMTSEERAAVVTEFQCALFSDLTIRLDSVFKRVVPGI